MDRFFLLARPLIIWIVSTSSSQASVVINEIAYHPISDSSAEEYIEIYNSGPNAVDLSDWSLEGARYTFSASTTIPASDYRVIAKDPASLSTLFPNRIGGPPRMDPPRSCYPLQHRAERIRE